MERWKAATATAYPNFENVEGEDGWAGGAGTCTAKWAGDGWAVGEQHAGAPPCAPEEEREHFLRGKHRRSRDMAPTVPEWAREDGIRLRDLKHPMYSCRRCAAPRNISRSPIEGRVGGVHGIRVCARPIDVWRCAAHGLASTHPRNYVEVVLSRGRSSRYRSDKPNLPAPMVLPRTEPSDHSLHSCG